MSTEFNWDVYEIAILLDYFYMYEKGRLEFESMLSLASLELLDRAKNNGIEVNENFWSENEIRNYINILKKEIYNIENGLDGVNNDFYAIVKLYINNHEKLEEILEQVNYESVNKKYAYYRYIFKKVKAENIVRIKKAYESLEKIIGHITVLENSFFCISDLNELMTIRESLEKNFKQNNSSVKFLNVYISWVKLYITDIINQSNKIIEKDTVIEVSANDNTAEENDINDEEIAQQTDENLHHKTYALNRYSTHAPKMEWFVEYFDKKNSFFEDNSLGVVMVPNFKRFLKDVKLYDETGYSETAEIIFKLGLENNISWAIMLINLANTPQVNWFIENTTFEELIYFNDLKHKLNAICFNERAINDTIYSLKRLLNLPFGELGLGALIYENEKAIAIKREPWAYVDDVVVLYGLYSYLELINPNIFDNDFYYINKDELFEKVTNTNIINFTKVFGVSRHHLDEILIRLSEKYTDYLGFDVSNIFLKRNIASFDVLNVMGEELSQLDIEQNKTYEIENNANIENNVVDIVMESFPTGYRLNSRMDYVKLSNNFMKKFESSLELEMGEIESILMQNGFVINEIVILDKQFFISDENILLDFLSNVDELIYYEKLLEIFKEDINPYMRDIDKLKLFIKRKTNNTYYLTDKYIQKNENKEITPDLILEKCMKEWGYVITLKELENELPYIPTYEIERMLKAKQYMSVEKDIYILYELINIDDSVIERLKKVLTENIEFNGHVSNDEFYNILKFDLNIILEENPMFVDNIPFAFKYFRTMLDKEYSFNRNIISSKDSEVSTKDMWEEFLKNNDTFNIDTLKILQEETKASMIMYNLVMDYAIRLNENDYIRKDLIEFDVDEIDNAIEFLLDGEVYIATSNIEEFDILPSVGYSWNSYLLESYVKHYSKKYKVMQVGNYSKSCSSTIVLVESEYKNINEIFADLLIKNNIEDNEYIALNFLVKNNYLSVRRYGEIDKVIKLIRK